jgi:hypothetical protein
MTAGFTVMTGTKHQSSQRKSPYSSRLKQGETGEKQSQEHAHHSLWHQGDFSQIIHPDRPNSQFRILLWRFMVTVRMCKDFGPNFSDNRSSCCIMTMHLSHFLSHQWISDQKQHDCRPPYSPDLASCNFSVSPVKRPPLWHKWGEWGRIACGAEHPHRKTTSRMNLKNGRSAGNGAYIGRELLWGCWLPVGPKLFFDQMEAPVPEIINYSGKPLENKNQNKQ